MRHRRLEDLQDEILENPNELFIRSKSNHSAMVSFRGGSSFLIRGDFSGTREECEAEARRVLSRNKPNRGVRTS